MLPKSQRLNLKKDFKRVSSGRKLETKYLKLFIKMGDPSTSHSTLRDEPSGSDSKSSGPRIGIAVSSKSFKKSTQRNRAKRVVSAAFEALYSKLPKTLSIVALPKPNVLNVKSGNALLDLEGKLTDEKIID